MANQKFDCGVPQANPADIVATQAVTDIGVPVTSALTTPINMTLGMTTDRVNRGPHSSLPVDIGIPFNPYNGTTNNY